MKAQKEKLRVIIFTGTHKIRGEVHLYENSRLTDIMNADAATKDFLPVTNATVEHLQAGHSLTVGFLSINRRVIEMVLEDDEAMAIHRAKEMIAKRKFPEALALAQRAVKALPGDAEAHYLLGFCLTKSNQTKAARAAFEQCLQLSPPTDIAHKAEDILGTLPPAS
jgi:tetratricopeptide (TPR) repeat protein